MKIIQLFIGFLFITQTVFAQSPRVPRSMKFAGMKITITDGAQKEIQQHVDALFEGGKFLEIKLERVKTHLPLVEKHLKKKNVPDDFKYLAIQESSFIGDAVSSSNAVGYWQFKKTTAQENGLRVNFSVDERMNLISSTQGAANYLQKNNRYLDNWVHTLISYYTGLGGVKKFISHKERGSKKFTVKKSTHWYFKKFLAHKIAYEAQLKDPRPTRYILGEYKRGEGMGLKDVAKEEGIEWRILSDFNPWLKRGKSPKDKSISFILPVENIHGKRFELAKQNISSSSGKDILDLSKKYPLIEQPKKKKSPILKINGIKGLIARKNDDLLSLTIRGTISEKKFLRYNEIDKSHSVEAGNIYYLKTKKRKARVNFHILKIGESLWEVSQKYGIRMKSIRYKNRMGKNEKAKAGRVLWLRKRRKKKTPVEYMEPKPEDTPPTDELLVDSADSMKTNTQPEQAAQEKLTKPDSYEELFKKTNQPKEKDSSPDNQENSKPKNSETDSRPDKTERQTDIAREHPEIPEFKEINTITHTVVKGDTYYSLSKKYNCPIQQLLNLNMLTINQPLKIGQRLSIPTYKKTVKETASSAQKSIAKDYRIHIVLKGETLYSISRKYNLSVEQLKTWNNKTDNSIDIGEELYIFK
ncbi:MAG: LysM peptidoglycan-binding domain-containing protein [Cytophagales bacterium]|nr:LysM peptidoglycan-binding domain-containing protein [Cytophagales bacterium]